MSPVDSAYRNAIALFGLDKVKLVKNRHGATDINIQIENVGSEKGRYYPKLVRLAYDGEYYWMSIDDFQWEFDNDAQEFLQTTLIYLRAILEQKIYISSINIWHFKFFKKLEIKD